MSSKPSFSRMPTCRRALSVIAAAVGFPCFASRSRSSEPALTPILIGRPRSRAASTTALTRAALPMLPGLSLSFATPASAARIAKW